MMIWNKKILIITLFIFFLLPPIVWSQVVEGDNPVTSSQIATLENISNNIGSQIDIIINPQTPKSGDLVTATLEGSDWDFDQIQITWYINGQKLASDYGLKKTSFTLGKNNVALEVDVLGADGKKGKGKVEIKPNEVVVIWEANSYTPPFYRGKALAPQGTVFRVIAIPNIKDSNGVKIPADKLVYKWKKNDQLSQNYSGFGKNIFYSIDETYVRDSNEISAEIYTVDNTAYYQTTIDIPHQETGLYLYKIDPLLGRLYNEVLGNNLVYYDKFVKLIAVPFFFSTSPNNSEISLDWTIGGGTINFSKPIIELESADGKDINLGLSIKHTKKLLQSSDVSITLSPKQKAESFMNTF